jgi:signal peptidase
MMARQYRVARGLRIAGMWGCAVVGLSVFALRHTPAHWGIHLVMSGSMAPAIHAGSLVLSRSQPAYAYRVGDIITYQAPQSESNLVTHRIWNVQSERDGERLFLTKGDANTNGDTWLVPPSRVVGRVVVVLPKLGYCVKALQHPAGFFAFIVVAFLFLVRPELHRLLIRGPAP